MIVYLVQAETHIAQISLENPYNDTLKISASNYTSSIRINWGDVKNLKQHNQSLELIINTKITKHPTNQYQIPILCLNNETATTISKASMHSLTAFTAIDCDAYGYKTNKGIQRININSSSYYGETHFYVSFFNISIIESKNNNLRCHFTELKLYYLNFYYNFKNKLNNIFFTKLSLNNIMKITTYKRYFYKLFIEDNKNIPVGNFELDQNNELTDDNYWQIDIEIGLYKELTQPIYCFEKGLYKRSTSICVCEKGFVGQYCEFQIKTINWDYSEKLIIQPYEYALFRFDYDDQYDIIFQFNDTTNFNLFYLNYNDSDTNLQQKFISTLQQRSYQISNNKQKVLNLLYNSTININSIVYWFENRHILPLEIDMKFNSKSLLKDFSHNFFNYTLTLAQYLLGGFIFICLLVFLVKKMKTFSRNNNRNTQDNSQSVIQNSQYNNDTDNKIGYQNIVELN